MKLRQAFKMAFKSIGSKKGRSFLTMLGIIIGIASVMTIVSTVSGMNKKQMEYYENQGTNKVTVYAYRYDGVDVFQTLYDYCLKLDDIVEGITPQNNIWTDNIKYNNKSAQSMDYFPEIYLGSDGFSVCNNFTIEKGRDLSFLDINEYSQVCVLGARTARDFFNYQNPVGETMMIDGVPFTVVGVYKEKDPDRNYSLDNIILIPYTASRVMKNKSWSNEFTIKAKSASAVKEVITRMEGFLAGAINEQNGYYYVYSQNQWIDNMNDSSRMMSLVLGGIAFISLLVGGIGIMNIMLVTVTERTREIGIRRAIGAERSSIVAQFLIEAASICGIGGIIGILFGFIGTLVAGKLLVQMILFPSVLITLVAFVFSVILGMIFGLYPAIKASGLQPVIALKAE